jgi:ATP-dependent Lhr-like helicase
VYEHLTTRGASFLTALQVATDVPVAAVTAALWDLVWAGLVTNDTFLPLRSLRAKRKAVTRHAVGVGGRWSAVRDLLQGPPPSDTERAWARAAMLLERYGIASGAAARAEELPGGFSAVYPVLRAMEDAGRARRGWFVDGIEGAQFAGPGAIDRLRAGRATGDDRVTVLAADDPANPWGTLLPWPVRDEAGPRPRRVAGAKVLLSGGRPVLYVERGERSWITLAAAGEEGVLAAAVRAWLGQQRDRWKALRLAKIDGLEAGAHPDRRALLDAGFALDGSGLAWVRSASDARVPSG